MALKTIGTNGTTSLSGFIVGVNDTIAADLASINTALKSDPPSWNGAPQGTSQLLMNQAYIKNGLLALPQGRGVLQLVNGDWVCWNAVTGWPIVVSAFEAANGPWTHT